MFKYLWIIPLVIAYAAAWLHAIREIKYTFRTFSFGHRLNNMEDFTVGWLLLHILGLFVCSFFAYIGKL